MVGFLPVLYFEAKKVPKDSSPEKVWEGYAVSKPIVQTPYEPDFMDMGSNGNGFSVYGLDTQAKQWLLLNLVNGESLEG